MPFLRMFRRKKSEQSKPKPNDTGHHMAQKVERFTACTFCHSDRFYEGPSGGASQNITCAKCGARFNIGLIPGGPVLLNTLSGPVRE